MVNRYLYLVTPQVTAQRHKYSLVNKLQGRMEEAFGELLFFDDFEGGFAEGWNFREFEPSWSVVQEDGNYLLRSLNQLGEPVPNYTEKGEVETTVHTSIIGSYEWTDYTLEFRIKVDQQRFNGYALVNLKYTPDLSRINPNIYNLSIAPNWISLDKIVDYQVISLASHDLRTWFGGWINIKVEVYGANIKVYVNGVLGIDYTDPEPLEKAIINFSSDIEYAYMYLDDVRVTRRK